MALILNRTMAFQDWAMELRDKRTDEWFLVNTPLTPITIALLYLITVWLGPVLMKNKQPLQLKWCLVIYNLGMVGMSVYMFYEFLVTSLLSKYSFVCQSVDYSNSELSMRMASVVWWFYISKIIELLDTVFFILRKKNDQLSFLHVYHHSTMVLLFWLGIRYTPGGETWFPAMLNSFVHIVMYSYYGLAAIGPHMQKYLWWKRYLTRLQLVQFLIFIIHAINNLYNDCDYPFFLMSLLFGSAFSHAILFGNFYYQSFVKRRKHDAKMTKTS